MADHKPSFIGDARENLTLLALLLTSACFLPAAHGADVAYAAVLQRHAAKAESLELEFRLAIERAAERDERFDLYRTCDQLIGTWLQIESLETQLAAQPDEPTANATLRDQAQFARWQIDQAMSTLERGPSAPDCLDCLRLNATLRALFSDVGYTVDRLLVEQEMTSDEQ